MIEIVFIMIEIVFIMIEIVFIMIEIFVCLCYCFFYSFLKFILQFEDINKTKRFSSLRHI
jgi:hypothetical protein